MNVTTPIDKVQHAPVRRGPIPSPQGPPPKFRRRWPLAAKLALWLAAVPLILVAAVYAVLLLHPIPLPFVRDEARAAVLHALPAGSNLELGDMRLALEGWGEPVIQFTPVVYTDRKTGAKIGMQALEIGFSPFRALIGQPGAVITMVRPHIQVTQDLLGPRLTSFNVVDSASGPATVEIQQGQQAFPSVAISDHGVNVVGELPGGKKPALRSDNDWLIYNLEAAERSLDAIVEQADSGRFSKLVIRDGVLDMHDSVYGLLRQFKRISLNVAPSALGHRTVAKFSASLGGRVMTGTATRAPDPSGNVRLDVSVSNIDFASVLPFIDDPDSMLAVRGGGALSMAVTFDKDTGKVRDGLFRIDVSGTDLRVHDDYFPIVTSIVSVSWTPDTGQFVMAPAEVRIGKSTATVSGVFRLGLDRTFGPTVGMSIKAEKVRLVPYDMPAPAQPFDEVDFSGWSAPLYGALGIDRLEARKGDGAEIVTSGRLDMLRKGMGLELAISGQKVSADDIKRMWPYFISREARDWFVANVTAGRVRKAAMRFAYPVGTLSQDGEDRPTPEGAVSIDMVGTGVVLRPLDSMTPVPIAGDTELKLRDTKLTVSGKAATIGTGKGVLTIANPALVMQWAVPDQRIIELSGDVSAPISTLVAFADQQQPGATKSAELPVDLHALSGNAAVKVVTTLRLDKTGGVRRVDYAVNGNVSDFASTSPIEKHMISAGQLSFTASQLGYHIAGKARLDGMDADLVIDAGSDFKPHLVVTSTIEVKDLKAMGFDATEFLSGKVRFAARPMDDGTIQMAVDIKDAGLNIKDLGISKPVGVPGSLEAAVRQDGDTTELSQIKLQFGSVDLEGGLVYDNDKGLQSASFSKFALSPGDSAQLRLKPIEGGYAVTIRGDQLDLKPMLRRFFGLGEGSLGAVASTQFQQTLALDVVLKRALGFYKTTAFNFNLNMAVRGSDLERVELQAQLGADKTVSVTTNPAPNGHAITAAFNDFGSLLRLIGVYPRVEGGDGSVVFYTNSRTDRASGEFQLHNFALINEDEVTRILGNHGSRIAPQNKLEFRSGTLDFIRSADRIEVTNGQLAGDTVGGTMHGFIYTQRRQYDLVGTYVPLYGINNVFQKLPILGPILGGKEGEGLIGVTFAVRGPLDHPEFQINPASLLVPGAFRSLFEYQAKDLPPTTGKQK